MQSEFGLDSCDTIERRLVVEDRGESRFDDAAQIICSKRGGFFPGNRGYSPLSPARSASRLIGLRRQFFGRIRGGLISLVWVAGQKGVKGAGMGLPPDILAEGMPEAVAEAGGAEKD